MLTCCVPCTDPLRKPSLSSTSCKVASLTQKLKLPWCNRVNLLWYKAFSLRSPSATDMTSVTYLGHFPEMERPLFSILFLSLLRARLPGRNERLVGVHTLRPQSGFPLTQIEIKD